MKVRQPPSGWAVTGIRSAAAGLAGLALTAVLAPDDASPAMAAAARAAARLGGAGLSFLWLAVLPVVLAVLLAVAAVALVGAAAGYHSSVLEDQAVQLAGQQSLSWEPRHDGATPATPRAAGRKRPDAPPAPRFACHRRLPCFQGGDVARRAGVAADSPLAARLQLVVGGAVLLVAALMLACRPADRCATSHAQHQPAGIAGLVIRAAASPCDAFRYVSGALPRTVPGELGLPGWGAGPGPRGLAIGPRTAPSAAQAPPDEQPAETPARAVAAALGGPPGPRAHPGAALGPAQAGSAGLVAAEPAAGWPLERALHDAQSAAGAGLADLVRAVLREPARGQAAQSPHGKAGRPGGAAGGAAAPRRRGSGLVGAVLAAVPGLRWLGEAFGAALDKAAASGLGLLLGSPRDCGEQCSPWDEAWRRAAGDAEAAATWRTDAVRAGAAAAIALAAGVGGTVLAAAVAARPSSAAPTAWPDDAASGFRDADLGGQLCASNEPGDVLRGVLWRMAARSARQRRLPSGRAQLDAMRRAVDRTRRWAARWTTARDRAAQGLGAGVAPAGGERQPRGSAAAWPPAGVSERDAAMLLAAASRGLGGAGADAARRAVSALILGQRTGT